jgi:hypothetical protein
MENILKNILYINLDHRIDRQEHLVAEMKKIGITNPERFPAVKMELGNIGCTFSHIRCLELAKMRDWDQVFICEDDITFVNPELFLSNLEKFIASRIKWDVLVVGGNNAPPFIPENDFCVRVQNIQTTTGYIVKKKYYDVLLSNFKEGVTLLIREPEKKKQFSIDIYWKILQNRDRWFTLIPLSVIQYYDYSDIEGKVIDYGGAMLDLEKKELMEYLMKEEEKKRRFGMPGAICAPPFQLGFPKI